MSFQAKFTKIEASPISIRSELVVTSSLESQHDKKSLIQKINIETVYIILDNTALKFNHPKIHFQPHELRKGDKLVFKVIIDLTQFELDKIESIRTKDVKINFWQCNVTYFELESESPFNIVGLGNQSFNTTNYDGSAEMMIPHSKWIDLTNELGYKNTRLFEIPLLSDSPFDNLKEIAPYLEKATKSFREGNYDDVLTSCRKSIEKFRELYPYKCKEEDSPDCEDKLFKKVFKKLIQSDSKTALIDELIGKIRSFSQKGVHINSIISRKDAELCLGITLELFRYIGRTLNIELN